MSAPTPLQEIDFDLARLAADFPPVWRHPHKQAIHDRVRRESGQLSGELRYSRWEMTPLAEDLTLHACDVQAEAGFFAYAESNAGVWHLNFADPRLFAAYGSPLMAQDEWQVLEHPVLGSLREALIHADQPALTRQDGISTPVLVTDVPRQCAIDLSGGTAPPSSWLRGLFGGDKRPSLYGNAFATADREDVMRCVTVLHPPTHSNIIAIAAPTGSGAYTPKQITDILQTAFNAFSAAALHSTRHGIPSHQVTIHTGWWGCGAFGGSRPLMALLQILAARMVGVRRLVFHIGTEGERSDFHEALACLDLVTAQDTATGTATLLSEIEALRFHWGQSDGN